MEVNWDQVAHDAENTPRSVLLEAMEQAVECRSAVVILVKRDGTALDEVWYAVSGSTFEATGLMEYVKAQILRDSL